MERYNIIKKIALVFILIITISTVYAGLFTDSVMDIGQSTLWSKITGKPANLDTDSTDDLTTSDLPTCIAGQYTTSDGSALTCDTPAGGVGGGAGDKWIDGGTYISPNSTYASNVKVFGTLSANDWSNASKFINDSCDARDTDTDTDSYVNETIVDTWTSNNGYVSSSTLGTYANITFVSSSLSTYTNKTVLYSTLSTYSNKTYVDNQDSAQDACSEITGCIENAITDGNTGWDNSYGFWNHIENITAFVNASCDARDSDTTYSESDAYLTLVGTVFGFSEAKLNTTISNSLATTYYNATRVLLVTGTGAGATSNINKYDKIPYNVSEVSSALQLLVNFTGVATNFNQVVISYKSATAETHTLTVSLWDYSDSTWHTKAVLTNSYSDYFEKAIGIYDAQNYVSGGKVKLRIYLATSTPSKTDKWNFDWITISKGVATPSGVEIDPYSIHKDGTIALTSNWNAGAYNITAQTFKGKWNGSSAYYLQTNPKKFYSSLTNLSGYNANLNVNNSNSVEGTDMGTLTNAKWCVYDGTNTEIDCNVEPVTDTDTNTMSFYDSGTYLIPNSTYASNVLVNGVLAVNSIAGDASLIVNSSTGLKMYYTTGTRTFQMAMTGAGSTDPIQFDTNSRYAFRTDSITKFEIGELGEINATKNNITAKGFVTGSWIIREDAGGNLITERR